MLVSDVRLLNCEFKTNYEYAETENLELSAQIDFGSKFEEDKKIITGKIKAIVLAAQNLPYNFEIEVGGKFELEEGEETRLKQLCTTNIPAILFPYLRETIADITRRSGNQALHLSTMNFQALSEASEENIK